MNPNFLRNGLILLVLLGFGLTVAFLVFHSEPSSGTPISMAGPGSVIAHVKDAVHNGAHVTLAQQGNMVTLREQGRTYHAAFDQRLDLSTFLRNNGVNVRGEAFRRDVTLVHDEPSQVGVWTTVVGVVLSFVIAVVLVLAMMNRARGAP